MLIILNSSLHGFDTEAQGRFQFHDEFIVNRSGHRVEIVILSLGLIQAIPRMLLEAFYIDSLGWIGHKDLGENVFSVVREELRQRVLGIHDFLVQI